MNTEVIEYWGRDFDPTPGENHGNCIGYSAVAVTVLTGVTLNGSHIEPRDFDSRGHLALLG